MKEQLKRIPNWKAQGADGVQSFWIENLHGIHNRITEELNEVIRTGVVPAWMTADRTTMCINSISRGNAADNYRPISCFPLMWKVLTRAVANEIYAYMEARNLFPAE